MPRALHAARLRLRAILTESFAFFLGFLPLLLACARGSLGLVLRRDSVIRVLPVARVEEARANLGITRSNQIPQFNGNASVELTRLSRDGQTPLPVSFVREQNRNWGQASLNLLSFEVDLWGRLRRATEASRANLL